MYEIFINLSWYIQKIISISAKLKPSLRSCLNVRFASCTTSDIVIETFSRSANNEKTSSKILSGRNSLFITSKHSKMDSLLYFSPNNAIISAYKLSTSINNSGLTPINHLFIYPDVNFRSKSIKYFVPFYSASTENGLKNFTL